MGRKPNPNPNSVRTVTSSAFLPPAYPVIIPYRYITAIGRYTEKDKSSMMEPLVVGWLLVGPTTVMVVLTATLKNTPW